MTRGFLLGKFLPPHMGHMFLCEFARGFADEVTILVCALDSDPIPGALRVQWMRELLPWARVAYVDDDVPQEPGDHPDFWSIWRDIVRGCHPDPIDFIFASEAYGQRLAVEVGARFVPVDPDRLAVPVSGRDIRRDPLKLWRYLPPPVRAHYTKTICLLGPESTGKSTLAAALARHFDTIIVPEYGRTHTNTFGVECSRDDLLRIAHGHRAAARAAMRQANRLAILDTDAVLTAVWAEMLLGTRFPELDVVEPSDFYLLTGIDFPWTDDGTRYFPSADVRQIFFERCRAELERRKLPYVLLTGDHETRLQTAIGAIVDRYPGCSV